MIHIGISIFLGHSEANKQQKITRKELHVYQKRIEIKHRPGFYIVYKPSVA